jgi:hypothetical protein
VTDPTILTDPADEAFARNQQWAKKEDRYLTKLDPKEESQFQNWVKENAVPFDPTERADYDMRGFWKAAKSGDPRASTQVNPNDGKMHFPDVWKTPYHQSFSVQSQYATAAAPNWNDQDQLVAKDGTVLVDERAQAAARAAMAAKAAQP